MMVSFCVLSFFPRDVLDEILELIESVSEGFPTYFCWGWTKSCLMLDHSGFNSGFLLLRYLSGVVRYPGDLQVSQCVVCVEPSSVLFVICLFLC